ncbi:peptide-methionine (R)-S-oxide reductase MsrB [Aquimarina agarilytica]|uniref:peptide-methionine (R)-S-oxide reductase MsrB n=1 Tax=Aquimarina agarilytica TaxID=1087449 RepID=UPI000287B117|nr:peptide-methionine (R)-S-oxide reductase MsrB [Aquimarina agarilytica]
MKKILTFISICGILFSCKGQENNMEQSKTYAITKTEAEWKADLSDFEYYVLRQAGTERAFTGEYDKHYKKGIYQCKACHTPLYDSAHKFDSGTGWPSFYQAIENNVDTSVDYKLGYARKELLCASCGSHLGHVFGDGPRPTGKRHCINSVSLEFKSTEP